MPQPLSDQVILFWKILFSIRLFLLFDKLMSSLSPTLHIVEESEEWSLNSSVEMGVKEVVKFIRQKEEWEHKLQKWETLVQTGVCSLFRSL